MLAASPPGLVKVSLVGIVQEVGGTRGLSPSGWHSSSLALDSGYRIELSAIEVIEGEFLAIETSALTGS